MATTIETPPQKSSISPASGSGQLPEHLPPALDSSHALAKADEFWHRTAPRRLVAAQRSDSPDVAWREWQRHLADRKPPKLSARLQSRPSPLLWGLSPALEGERFGSWLADLAKSAKSPAAAEEFFSEWLSGAHERGSSLTAALEHVAVAAELPNLAAVTSDTLWWGLCDCLYSVAVDAGRASPDAERDPAAAVAQQLLAGELAVWLALHLPEVDPARALRKSGHEVFSEALVELLDGEGLPHAHFLPWWRPLFACWTRAGLLGEQFKKGVWSTDAQTQYEWLIRETIRFSRYDGSLVLRGESESEWSPDLLAAALDMAGDDADCAAAEALLPGRIVPDEADFDDDDLPDPSNNSEWSGLALLATGWSKTAPRLALAYAQHPMEVELSAGREVIWRGAWQFELTCDGRPVSYIDDDEWEEQCWQSDEDCDYLELALELEGGLRLERQLLLGRDDAVLYLADYVLAEGEREREFEYRMHLPLAESVRFEGEKETRDGLLVGTKSLAAVIPPALTEWRSDPRGGELSSDGRRLTLTRQHRGRRFCCPLFLDFKPRRLAKERTWRQLTVAEMLDVLSPDVAVGYRLQSGKDQWLVYRSLGPAANRTLLGYNISSEFCAGRFLRTGEVDELIEIETDDDE